MKKLEDTNILVVGDIMLDHYIYGNAERLSPEAPVPVVKVTKEYYNLGGCGNVARNIRKLGPNVTCIAAVGKDKPASIIHKELKKLGITKKIVETDEVTTQKIRIVANQGHTQIVRVDKEKTKPVKLGDIEIGNGFDIIVVSDYAKGMITADLMHRIKELNIPIIVDPKPSNMWLYNDVFMITPNKKEYDEICLSSEHPFSKNIRYVLRTLGKEGMELMEEEETYSIPSIPVDVYNVIGAGDTVVSVMAVCISIGVEVSVAAKIANDCARYVITQPGTSTIYKKAFFKIVGRHVQWEK